MRKTKHPGKTKQAPADKSQSKADKTKNAPQPKARTSSKQEQVLGLLR